MEQWFYVLSGAQQGPVSVDQLRGLISSGQIPQDTQVWCERLTGWQAANLLPEFSFAPRQPAQPAYPPGGTYAPGGYSQPGYAQPGYPPGAQGPLGYHSAVQQYGPVYAGFWIRVGAYIIDYLVLLVPLFLVGVVIGLLAVAASGGKSNQDALQGVQAISNLIGIVLAWLYFALMESSAGQATIGKRVCGLRVTDSNGNRLTFGRATGRYFGKIISGLICCVGFMMAGWTERKQGLHDQMAGTYVLYGRP